MGLLFISHSSRDNDQAIKVRDWLRANGWGKIFLDLDPTHGLATGQRWQEELKRAGENCSAVIVLVSPNWIASRWCQTEFLVADQLGKRIFPVFIAPTSFEELPLELRAKFYLADISTPEKESEGFERLATGLKRAGLDPKSFEWPPTSEPNRSVYRGLQALDVQDAAILFGRDAHITMGLDELRRLRDGSPKRMMVILGSSGAGKSSFLRAGLIARLKRDEENFLVLPIVRPERSAINSAQGLAASVSAASGVRFDPASAGTGLAQSFAAARVPIVERLQRHAEAAHETITAKPPTIVVPIDQAEELFGAENAERAGFCEMLADAVTRDGNALIVATIRSDSYEPMQVEPHLAGIGQVLFNLPPIAAGSFQEIIEGPARLAKPPLAVESELTQQLLADLDEADALPLLAFTLERLQGQNVGNGKLALMDYRNKLGGFSGAIQSAVNAVLGAQPSKESLALARRLFVPALVQVDRDGVKRRVACRQDLPQDVHALANQFVAQRLLVTDRANIEIAHEAILRQWPTLAGWIAEERVALTALDAVRAAAHEWETHHDRRDGKGGESWLAHRGDRLKEALSILARADFSGVIDEGMHLYLLACERAEKLAKSTARRARHVTYGLVAVVMVSLLGIIYKEPIGRLWFEFTAVQHFADTNFRPFVLTPVAELALKPGDSFRECKTACPEMVVLPTGSFMMGSPAGAGYKDGSEYPAHIVTIAKTFAVSKFELTWDDWQACVDFMGCDGAPTGDGGYGRGNHPLINVSWDQAKAYVAWLSKMTGKSYRLLTEAEWEYAARGVTRADRPYTTFYWGDVANRDYANYGTDSCCEGARAGRDKWLNTAPVGQFRPNSFGLYDMLGNVWEWVEDGWHANYDGNPPADGSEWIEGADKDLRVVRGGGWYSDISNIRLADRIKQSKASRDDYRGFRVARSIAVSSQ